MRAYYLQWLFYPSGYLTQIDVTICRSIIWWVKVYSGPKSIYILFPTFLKELSYSFSLKVLIYTKQPHKINCACHIPHRVLTKTTLVFMLSTTVVMHSHNKLQKYIDVLLWDKCRHASPWALNLFFFSHDSTALWGSTKCCCHGAPLKVCVCWWGGVGRLASEWWCASQGAGVSNRFLNSLAECTNQARWSSLEWWSSACVFVLVISAWSLAAWETS